jgi:hypothetical protein
MSTHTYDSIPPQRLSEARKAELCVWLIRFEMAAYYGVLGAAALTIGFLASLH